MIEKEATVYIKGQALLTPIWNKKPYPK